MKKEANLKGLRNLINRRMFIILLIIAQIVGTALFLFRLKWMQEILTVFSIVTALHLLTRPDKSAFKLSLIFIILLFPIFGGAFYWIFHAQTLSIGFRMRLSQVEKKSQSAFPASHIELREAGQALPTVKKQLSYMEKNTPFPLCGNTETKYFPSGAAMLPRFLEDLKSAERYIFLEYFIIEHGEMWDSILEVLKERAAAGVDVRIIYDDLGCFLTLSPDYPKYLHMLGIKCEKFNRFHPFLTSTQNNRDHRKITSIDGKIAYTGGINLADEYIGAKIKCGKWKDSAIRLCGDGAWSFTVMFLQIWGLLTREEADYAYYRPSLSASLTTSTKGWVQPYADGPISNENVGEQVYQHIIEGAQQYLYITTPYLMVDDGMISALESAAKSGVDVRIITPEIPDKKAVLFTTRSYYRTLLGAGVRIYEYADGFMHAKTFLADDAVATVGTFNLDFRSLYLHFECGTCLYGTDSIADMKQDFIDTLKECKEITQKDCKANAFVRFWQSIFRIFAPLM